MLHVVEVELHPPFTLHLSFSDGSEGYVDLWSELEGAVFEPLRDASFFARVAINNELGTISWPNGADFAPEFLHSRLQTALPGR